MHAKHNAFAFLGMLCLCGLIAAQAKPVNLKVLPRDITIADLYTRMGNMQKDLGVTCNFCHEEDPETKQINYASDENPRKETARLMMRMTNDINEKYLGTLGDRQYAPPVTCGNCHLGQMHPPAYDAAAKGSQ